MARLFLSSGETYKSVGAGATATQVTGTNSNETVYVDANGDAAFDASFNRGGDTIIIGGNAANYTASIVGGSSLLLTSAGGASITIPIGSTGATISFADAAGRTLVRDGSGSFKLGGQTIATSGTTAVTPGDGAANEFFLTPNQDTPSSLGSSSGNDLYLADVVQVNGLQVNTLGTGDSINGGAGFDTLQAQIYRAATFDGNGGLGINGGSNAPIQPRLNSVEKVTLEALNSDLSTKSPYNLSIANLTESQATSGYLYSNNTEVYFNAKNVRGHNEIWSWYSDANLTVQDLTTIVTDGTHDAARNTSEITIGVGYTSGQDTFWDSSDTKVFFDQDFLLTGKENSSRAFYFLLDEKADLAHRGTQLLDFIDTTGIVFTVSGYNNNQPISLIVPNIELVNTHLEFVAALQPALAAAKAAGLVPADLTITVDPTITRTTGLDDLSESSPIPAIVVSTQTAAVITPVGYSHEGAPTGSFDVFGVFTSEPPVETPLPLSVNIALEKVGRGGHGGDVIVGSMDKYYHGIDVFNVTVYGDKSRPSWVDYLNSTGGSGGIGEGGALDTINIVSDNVGFPSSTFADLTVGATNSGMSLIDATGFKGNLALGVLSSVVDLKTLIATGGGDVTYEGSIYTPNQYLYQTGAGKDSVSLYIEGDALEYATSGLLIDTGSNDDSVDVRYSDGTTSGSSSSADFPNHVILKNVDINTGTGNDTVTTHGQGQFRINTGEGNDTIYSEQDGSTAAWVFNVDRAAYDSFDELNGLPGVPLRTSLLDGATVTVVFSGAGSSLGGEGGGVDQAYGLAGALGDAINRVNGFEGSATIDVPAGKYYGTQADINNAIIAAIKNSPVLSKLLTAEIGANNTLVVRTIADGSYVQQDLDIVISRPTYYSGTNTAAIPSTLISEAISLGLIASNSVPANSTWKSLYDSDPAHTVFNILTGAALDNGFYAGIDNGRDAPTFDNFHYSGSAGYYEADHIHTPGAGNDVVVLSTNAYGSTFSPDVLPPNTVVDSNVYATLDGWLFDTASNETIVLSGNFGNDAIVNFTTAGFGDHDTANVPVGTGSGTYTAPNSGFDFLDFTAYLTSQFSESGSVASRDPIPVTLQDVSGGDAPVAAPVAAGAEVDANEVFVVSLDDTVTGETWSSLTATTLAEVINNSVSNGGSYGNLSNGSLDVRIDYVNTATNHQLVDGIGKAVILVQNADNLGQYKVFEVQWNGLASATNHTATVTERGQLDFGASLEGLDELNLVGSVEYSHFNFDSSYLIA